MAAPGVGGEQRGYDGAKKVKGAGWVHKVLGWTAEIVKHPPKSAPEEVMRAWVKEFDKEDLLVAL